MDGWMVLVALSKLTATHWSQNRAFMTMHIHTEAVFVFVVVLFYVCFSADAV